MEEGRLRMEKRVFSLFILLVLVAAVWEAYPWPLRASIVVLLLGSVGVVLAILQLVLDFKPSQPPKASQGISYTTPNLESTGRWGNLEIWSWILGFYAAIHLVGFLSAVPLFVFFYSKIYGARWPVSLALSLLCWGFVYGIFEQLMHVPWPKAILFSLFSS